MVNGMDEQKFESGDEIIFHLSSFGALTVPLSKDIAEQTGQMMAVELNMMHGVYRDETAQHWIVDVTGIQPPLLGARLLKAGVDLIGVKSQIESVSRKLLD
jgi:hypothetical protein